MWNDYRTWLFGTAANAVAFGYAITAGDTVLAVITGVGVVSGVIATISDVRKLTR